MKKIIFALFLAAPSLCFGDRLGSLPSGADVLLSSQAVAGTGGGGYSVEPATVTFNLNKGVVMSTAVITQTLTGNTTAMMIVSTGTGNALLIIGNGVPAGGLQGSKGGIVNITRNALSDGLVIYSSVTSPQAGSTMLGLINDATGYNDPIMWIHNNGNSSNPFLRVDDAAPDMEIVNTSTDNAHGLGKWEPFAIANGGVNLQVNSRAYSNGTFENVAYWSPLSKGGGLTFAPVISGQDGNPNASNTQPVVFIGTNSSSVGLTGPKAPNGSWTFILPPRFANGGQVMYQTADNPRQWDFTTGGISGQTLQFNSSSSAPTWVTSTGTIGITIDGNGSSIVAGSTRSITIPYSCRVSSWTVIADVPGSISVDVKSSSFANYPTLTSLVGTGNNPSLSTSQKNSAIPSGWTSTTITQGDNISFVINSASTVQWVNIVLWVVKT